jgi:hypothetical protein
MKIHEGGILSLCHFVNGERKGEKDADYMWLLSFLNRQKLMKTFLQYFLTET